MRIRGYLSAWALVGLLVVLPGVGALAQEEEPQKDTVVFTMEQAPGLIPPVYNVFVKINDEEPRPVISVERIGSYPAQKRAEMIVERLTQSWSALPDRAELAGVLDVMKNRQYNVFVIAPTGGPGGLPTHIMQSDKAIAQALGETEFRALQMILEGLQNDLMGVEPATKAPKDKTLDDQKQIAQDLYSQATTSTGVDAERKLLAAIAANPEYPRPYDRLSGIYKSSNPVKAKSVQAALGRLQAALAERLKGDDAWDAGNYQEALKRYQAASAKFPECVTYYWLQSLTYEKLGQRSQAAKVLNDALAALPGKSLFDGLPAGGGEWGKMIRSRAESLGSP